MVIREIQRRNRVHTASGHECPHTLLSPRWRAAEDMGDALKAEYACEACGGIFWPSSDRRILREEARFRPAVLDLLTQVLWITGWGIGPPLRRESSRLRIDRSLLRQSRPRVYFVTGREPVDWQTAQVTGEPERPQRVLPASLASDLSLWHPGVSYPPVA